MKGTVLGEKEQGLGIREKGKGKKGKTEVEFDTEDQVLFSYLFKIDLGEDPTAGSKATS